MAPGPQRRSRRISSNKEYKAESAAGAKAIAIERLAKTGTQGSVREFLNMVYTIAAMAIFIPIPALAITLSPAEEGFQANLDYWFGYNGYVCLISCFQSWGRLLKICQRVGNEDFPPLSVKNDFGCNPKTIVCLLVFEMMVFSVSGAVGYLNGTHAAEQYNMLYLCPFIGTVGDVMFMMMLPKQERNGATAMFLATQAALWGMPIFFLFFPILLKVYLSPLQAAIIPVIIFPLLSEFVQKVVSAALIQQMVTIGYDTPWFETGVTIHLDAMISIGEMMLFPGADSPLVLATIIGVEVFQRVMDNRGLAEMMEPSEGSYAPLATTDESTTKAKNNFSIAWCCTTDEQTQFGKSRVKDMNAEAFEELQQKGVTILTALAAPVIFMGLSLIITSGGNRDKYFLYECLNMDNEMIAIEFAGIALATQYVFLIVDFCFLYSQGLAEAFVLVFNSFVENNWLIVIPTMAFPCSLFTSCFLIKHDGIAILQELLRHCPNPAEGSPFYKAAAAKES